MAKKFLTVCFVFAILSFGCGCDRHDDNLATIIVNSKNREKITPEIIEIIFSMKKNEIINYFDEDYEIVEAGPDAAYEGYYFEKLGLIFVFGYDYELDEYTDEIGWIHAIKPFEINGAHSGMTFSEIQECLGESEIYEDWYSAWNDDVTTYNIEYQIGQCIYRFRSFEPDGAEWSWLDIFWCEFPAALEE